MERQPRKFGEAIAADSWTEPYAAQVLEALPRLGRANKIQREPDTIRCECVLPPEKLLAVVEPIQGVLRAVIGVKSSLLKHGTPNPAGVPAQMAAPGLCSAETGALRR